MSTCFNCRAQPPDGMIYCLECGVRLDGEHETISTSLDPGQETIISSLHAGLPTVVESVPRPRTDRKIWALTAFISGLLTVAGGYIYLDESPIKPVEALPDIMSATERAHPRAVSAGVPQTRAKPLASLPAPVATATPAALKRVATTTEERRQSMQVRIEIIDGVNHCYAIPGGREVPCS
jgi:hypothetical protein